MQAMDKKAVKKYGIKGLQLMENAGRGVAEVVKRELLRSPNKRVSIIAGKGNNGGDGFVAARHLKNSGINVAVFTLSKLEEIKGDAGVNALSWQRMKGEVFPISTAEDLRKCESPLKHSAVIVDGIFGTGLSSPVRGIYAEAIGLINSLNKKVIAIDIPSGIDATTGAVLGCSVKASITATMAAPKIGLYLYPGRGYAGDIEIVDIGAPSEILEDKDIRWNLITDEDLKRILKPRKADSHKGRYGHLLLLAGSPGMTGAAYMAAMGAMRAGAGLATIGVPKSLQPAIEAKTKEVMAVGLPETDDNTLGPVSYGKIKDTIKGKTAVLIGSGFRPSEDIFKLIETIAREIGLPLVIDGGGLSALEGRVKILKRSKAKIVLTPHPGEMARLLGISTDEVQADRPGSAEKLAELTGSTVVLKGAGTVITDAGGQFFINPTGNPGLSTAGTGDVLAGMIGGLLAQGYSPLDSSCAAVYMHGAAADRIKKEEGEAGMVATDLLPYIPGILNSFTTPEA